MTEDPLDRAVREVEQHESAAGWDRRPSLYALVATEVLVREEPELAASLGLTAESAGALTAVAQDELTLEGDLPATLARLGWPPEVVGVVLTLETVALPATVEQTAPETGTSAWAVEQPDREEARVVVGVLRDGARAAALRWRSHDHADDVVTGPDLAPAIAQALAASLAPF